jgi:hypothetical protein
MLADCGSRHLISCDRRGSSELLQNEVAQLVVVSWLSGPFHEYGDAPRAPRRRPARREEREYREYLTDEQRRGTGCIGGRMPPYL